LEFINEPNFSKETLSAALVHRIPTPFLCVAMQSEDTFVCQMTSQTEQHVFSAPAGELFVIKDFTVSRCQDPIFNTLLTPMLRKGFRSDKC
jgi:hypothetical protein